MIQMSTHRRAMASKTTHKHVFRLGWVEYDDTPVQPGPHGDGRCDPPSGTVDGSPHLLLSPSGEAIRMAYVLAESAWEPISRKTLAHRAAFSADYLSSHGWSYLRPE